MSEDVQPISPVDLDKKLEGMIQESVGSMYRKQAETELQGEIAKRAKDELGICPKIFRKAVTAAFKANGAEVEAETDEVIDILERTKFLKREE
jgi:hypothetical protein